MHEQTGLRDAFLQSLPDGQRDAWAAIEGLEEALADVTTTSAAAWLSVRLSPGAFVQCLAARWPADLAPGRDFSVLNTADLYLAAACLHHIPQALQAFEQHCIRQVPAMLSYLRPSPTLVGDIQQQLREKLFTAPVGSRPKIADYSGRAALVSWVRSAAVRAAIDLLRGEKQQRQGVFEEEGTALLDAAPSQWLGSGATDAAQALLKGQHRDVVRQAFLTALASLAQPERNLLRYYYLEGLSVDQIAGLYQIHRATLFRKLEAVRNEIKQAVRAALSQRLRISLHEAESLVDLMLSQIDLSMSSVLDPEADKSGG